MAAPDTPAEPRPRPRPTTARRRWPWLVGGALLALVGLVAWFAWSATTTYRELTAARQDLLAARSALLPADEAQRDPTAAAGALDAAAEHAASAADSSTSPLWRAAAAVPVVGDTPQAVSAVAQALDEALTGLSAAGEQLPTLDPSALVAGDGIVDLAALRAAGRAVASAQQGLATARATLAGAPSRAQGAAVLPTVDAAATELAAELAELEPTLEGAATVAGLLPGLLGGDGPKRYFLAILNPNEARGTGGFLGTYAILRADEGRVTVEQIGSNSDLPTLAQLPLGNDDLGEQYLARYGDDPTLIANMNLSPHHPAAARNWLAAWEQQTGERLDGAFSADVVALGDLVTATGEQVPLPDGGSLSGEALTRFAIEGIYERFPEVGDVPARKAYQEAVTAAAIGLVTGSPNRRALASALGEALGEGRILLWSADEATQGRILEAGLGGTLRVPEGHHVAFAAINLSGSKLDAYLQRAVRYTVGRCEVEGTGLVESAVEVTLTNAIPEGAAVPEYMISLAERGPDGPSNRTIAQLHLPLGAEIDDVLVDGESVEYSTFPEQDRPAMLVILDLPPRQPRELEVRFFEPANPGPGSVLEQPLGSAQQTQVEDGAPCA